ncbi:MAG: hypothetical protein K5664_06710 [Firmicutes bacterium]|nr:hypothetical protein [Bacillota bacterium]
MSEEKYKEHHRQREHQRYLRREEKKVEIVSYDALSKALVCNDVVSNISVDVEETVIKKIMLTKLDEALKTLSRDELFLIEQLIYKQKTKSETGRRLHITHTAVRKRWNKLLDKLKSMLEN